MSIRIYFPKPIAGYAEARSAQFGAGRPSLAGGLPSRAQAHEFIFSRIAGPMSARLLQCHMTGHVFDSVDVEFYKDKPEALYMSYKLTEVIISGMSFSGGSIPYETLGLSFGDRTTKYFQP